MLFPPLLHGTTKIKEDKDTPRGRWHEEKSEYIERSKVSNKKTTPETVEKLPN